MLMLGLNIFTHAIPGMKKFLFMFFIFFTLGLSAQIKILSDVTTGCLPLEVNFWTIPDTTVIWDFENGDIRLEKTTSKDYNDPGTFQVICNIFESIDTADIDKIIINVFDCPDQDYIPNVFSPNDDGENDFFEVPTNKASSYEFSVFSRSGTLIYKSMSPTVIWDGRSLSGQEMTSGIYFYTLTGVNVELLNEIKGIVYLFK